MKIHFKTYLIPVAMIMAAGISSCSGLNGNAFPWNKGQQSSDAQSEPASLPTDREHIRLSQHNEKSFTAKDLEEGVVTGDWAIEEVNGTPVVAEFPAFIKFEPSTHRIYGNNGCNTINASYVYNQEEGTIKFENIATTMRLCAMEGITDLDINAALNNTTNYTWDHQADEYYLYFRDPNGIVLLKLMHQNFDFLNGSWQVVAIEDDPVNDPDMKLVIDVDERKIHGNTGCNILNGTMEMDMETANTLNFHDILVTQMECPDSQNQTRLIVALEDAAHARPVDSDKVILLNLLKKPVLTLKRL
ncbi:MAG: META domain-containing protein [Bacteroides sp.]|nr:META domain-containing protein [Bacteroides sp.]